MSPINRSATPAPTASPSTSKPNAPISPRQQRPRKGPTISFSGDVEVYEASKHGDTDSDEEVESDNVRSLSLDNDAAIDDNEGGYFVSHQLHQSKQPPGTPTVMTKADLERASPSNILKSSAKAKNSPSRTPTGTYAPVRTPSQSSADKKSSMKKKPSANSMSPEERKKESQEKYRQQEQAYVQKLTRSMWEDYHERAPEFQEVTELEDSEEDEEVEETNPKPEVKAESLTLGGVGTSFDDEYTELGSSYPLLDMKYSLNDVNNGEALRERLEWQAMLTSVLTGEVVRSEKRRLGAGRVTSRKMPPNDLWLQVRAKACGRSVEEQQRVVDYGRTQAQAVIDEVWKFRIVYGEDLSLDFTRKQVDAILNKVEKLERLWISTKDMKKAFEPYADPAFKRRLDALLTWSNTTYAISLELDLLRQWTGNDDLDPTIKPINSQKEGPNEELNSLVEGFLKQNDLERIFRIRIHETMDPLIQKAREATVEYSEVYVELGLPLFHERLSHLMQFPIKMIQEIMRQRLSYAKGLVNPTIMIIEQMIRDIGEYIKLAVNILKRNEKYTAPIFDKGWVFQNHADDSFNETVLACITHYLELLSSKFLRESKTSSRMNIIFKETDELEQQYNIISALGHDVKGADVIVAKQFSLLLSKLLTRLNSYWESQMSGPAEWHATELERFFGSLVEGVRGFQRKMLRFYKILCSTYENATDFSIHSNKLKIFCEKLRQTGHVLVYTGGYEKFGVYTIADPSLVNEPQKIRALLDGFCRNESLIEDESGGYILVLCIQEPLVWEGEIMNLDIPYFDVELVPGRMRLVSEGHYVDLKQARKRLGEVTGGNDMFDVAVDHRSHLIPVNRELVRVRKIFYRLAVSVISSVSTVRDQCKALGLLDQSDSNGAQECIQSLFIFAREFGQRGIYVMDLGRRGNVALKLIKLAIEWTSFICDDCVPSEAKTFRWCVTALDFGMVMTRGVNITAITNNQFSALRLKVAGCMTLLISHFDIMGARSKEAARQRNLERARRLKMQAFQYKDDDELMDMMREETRKKIVQIENARPGHEPRGKVLDENATETKFLSFLSSSFSKIGMRWQQGQFVGGGSFGSVYSALNLDTGGVMAVKEIRLQASLHLQRGLKSIKDEMTALEMLSHPNIVQYYGIEVHRDKVFIFMEYCQGGSLASLLEHGRIEDEEVTQVYTLQMLEGLAYLHSSGIVHRDIKPENILLDHMGIVKFVDFGGAKVIAKTGRTNRISASTRLNSMTGTPMYMSPEVITGADPGKHGSIDIWSTGCCILEMVTGRRPWANLDNDWAIMYHIAAGHLPQLPSPDQMSNEGIDFLMKCLQRDPQQRLSAAELLREPWMMAISSKLIGDPAISDTYSNATANDSNSNLSSPSSTTSSISGVPFSQVQSAARSIQYSYASQSAAQNMARSATAAAAGTVAGGGLPSAPIVSLPVDQIRALIPPMPASTLGLQPPLDALTAQAAISADTLLPVDLASQQLHNTAEVISPIPLMQSGTFPVPNSSNGVTVNNVNGQELEEHEDPQAQELFYDK